MPTKNNDFTGLYLLAVVGMAVDVFFSYNNILTEYMIIPRLIYVPSYILSGIIIIRDSIRADKERFEQTMIIRKAMIKNQFERDYADFCRELHSK